VRGLHIGPDDRNQTAFKLGVLPVLREPQEFLAELPFFFNRIGLDPRTAAPGIIVEDRRAVGEALPDLMDAR